MFQKHRAALVEAFENQRNHQSYIFSGSNQEEKQNIIYDIFSVLAKSTEGRETQKEKAKKGIHPDFYVVSPIEDSISVEQIRELPKQIRFHPLESNKRILLIQDAHKMNMQAANAFLKLYEEPPEHSVFFLLVPDLKGLPQTILSRSLIVRYVSEDQTYELGNEFDLLTGKLTVDIDAHDDLQKEIYNFGCIFLDLLTQKREAKVNLLAICEKANSENSAAFATTIEVLIRDLLLFSKGVEKPIFSTLSSRYKKISNEKNNNMLASLEVTQESLDRFRVAREFHGSVPLNLMQIIGSIS